VISIVDTGLGKCSVNDDIEAVLRKIEYWHQGSISTFKIMCRDGKGVPVTHGKKRAVFNHVDRKSVATIVTPQIISWD
jgi:hypothetical protein